MNIKILKKKSQPLCFLPNGCLLYYSANKLFVLHNNIIIKKVHVKISLKERILHISRYATRFFRIGIRAAIAIDNFNIILSIGNKLYELNIETGILSEGFYCGEGIRPLIFSSVRNIPGFSDGIYFGGYLGNMEKNSVNIYHRIGVDKWEVVYTFPQGTINHVHNVVPDPYCNCLWVFTGDFDTASAIWKVTDNFKKVERVACNNQKYRACVVFPSTEGLLYATDAPYTDNYIYLMNTESYDVKVLFPIHGSCIYGCQWKDSYVFSSTVEGDGRNTTRLEFLFGRERGAGIKDEYVHMYMGNLKEGFHEIYKEKKDGMPYYTFQFGVFKFPNGINNSDMLYFQPVATRVNDQHLMTYSE